MPFGIRYETIYRYESDVGFSPHELRIFPRGDRFAQVQQLDFRTTPEADVRFRRDQFDNIVAGCFFSKPARELRFELALELEVTPKDPFHFILEKPAANAPFDYASGCAEILRPYFEARIAHELAVPGWAKPTREKPRGTVRTLVELNRALFENIRYERREEGAAFSPEETLRAGRGACRDVAVLLAEVLRQTGFAARLASGYLLNIDPHLRQAEGSLHAWTEVYLPGAGWIGMDPTNNVLCDHNFVATAVGLTPADITPISGSYYQRGSVAAEMSSRVQYVRC